MYKVFERSIEAVSPSWARKRLIAKAQCDLMRRATSKQPKARTQGYEAGSRDRQREAWIPKTLTADGASFQSLDLIINRSRYLSRNTSWGKAVILAYGRNVVGCGIRPTPCVLNEDGTANVKFNKAAKELFNAWGDDHRQCDLERRLTFWAIQKQAMQQMIEAGEVFYRPVMVKNNRRRDNRVSPFAIHRMEVEQLDKNLLEHNNNEVRRGIELDEFNAAVGYWFMDRPDGDAGIRFPSESVRFDADGMIHLFLQERSGQTHGVPPMAPVINKFRDMAEMDAWELYSAKVQSAIALIVNTVDGETQSLKGQEGDDLIDSRGNPEDIIEPAMIWHGKPGEDVKAFSSSRPSNNYIDFINEQKQSAAAGVDLSFEQVSRNFTRGSYSSQRQSLLEDIRAFKCYQKYLISNLCVPIYRLVIETAVMQGKLEAPDFHRNPAKWTASKWRPPGWGWIDPLKESQGNEIQLENDMTTLDQLAAARGEDWAEILEQKKVEQDKKKALGLDPSKPQNPRNVVEQTNQKVSPAKRRQRRES